MSRANAPFLCGIFQKLPPSAGEDAAIMGVCPTGHPKEQLTAGPLLFLI
ncbi:hypothetical protein STRDD11_00248 [Streptococcus sp. DD11]|nr:hypothetical protein STRDD11_00248 [Streptococcus sp. DD11]